MLADCRGQSLAAVGGFVVRLGFDDAIREKHHTITVTHRTLAGGEHSIFDQSERGAGAAHDRVLQRLHFPRTVDQVQGQGMGGVGVGDLAARHVSHHVERGGKHGDAGFLEHAGKNAVDLRQQLAGIRRRPAALFHLGPQHCGDERRAHVVAHDVADEHADSGVGNPDDIEEIAANGAGGDINAGELQRAFGRANAGRNARELVGQHGLLQLARHLQFVFNQQVLLTQLVGAFGQRALDDLAFGDVARYAESSDDAPGCVAQGHLGG